MKVINLCLLVVAAASFLLTTANANAVGDFEDFEAYTDAEIEQMIADELGEGEFMGVDQLGLYKILLAGYKGVNGTLCLIDEVADIMLSCTGYVTDLATCTGNIPTDVKAVLKHITNAIDIGSEITHFKTELCASKTRGIVSGAEKAAKCAVKLSVKTLSMIRQVSDAIKLTGLFPTKTGNCYVSSTKSVVGDCKAFVPNLKSCVTHMTS
ncbi:uncharacterized protein [Drosophila takahashii]|uniref:uncharacterized protein n=1 Tax=Drosophila takahashii TaxID=29030 RepID=UPI001CF86C3F|nr:uncharacterized protein LOC108064015 [Drosophila takahashii]